MALSAWQPLVKLLGRSTVRVSDMHYQHFNNLLTVDPVADEHTGNGDMNQDCVSVDTWCMVL